MVGYAGYSLLKYFYTRNKETEVDPALLLAIPIITFVVGDFLGGAGFLAAFVSGLMSDLSGSLKQASHFYENFLNNLIKPLIFIILGALVPLGTLIKLLPLGILISILFMFVVRPLAVFISLLPWFWKGSFRIGDIVFLSFVRETGIIAAVLLIIASASGIIDSEFIIAIGMWAILLTLVLEPPLTPYVARLSGVADKS